MWWSVLWSGRLRRFVSICNSNSAKLDLDVTDLDKLVGRAELPRPSSGKRKGRFLGMSQKSTFVH